MHSGNRTSKCQLKSSAVITEPFLAEFSDSKMCEIVKIEGMKHPSIDGCFDMYLVFVTNSTG